MRITSPAFAHNEHIPKQYTCDGKNISPPLTFDDIPQNAKSLVLIMEDPDVPKQIREDCLWIHWILFNIPSNTKKIDEGSCTGVPGLTTNNTTAYSGPCPPDKKHRYFFKLYALDTTIIPTVPADKSNIEMAMAGHILDTAELIGLYQREASYNI